MIGGTAGVSGSQLMSGIQLPLYSTVQFTSTWSDSCTALPGKLMFSEHDGSEAIVIQYTGLYVKKHST